MVFIYQIEVFTTLQIKTFFLFLKKGKLSDEKQTITAITPDFSAFYAITRFLCSNCSQKKRASTKVIEAMFYTGGTEHSVLLWEGSAALTVVKRDEREGV